MITMLEEDWGVGGDYNPFEPEEKEESPSWWDWVRGLFGR
ncbi:hypothetical protein EJP02_186 [Escherichia phage EJP2]|nr:hypothetical protein EJP02_186 [Escherichia phage EJP2]